MIFNNNGPVYEQSDKAPEAKKKGKEDIESTEPIKAAPEAPVIEKTLKVEPKKRGSRSKAKKSEDK